MGINLASRNGVTPEQTIPDLHVNQNRSEVRSPKLAQNFHG